MATDDVTSAPTQLSSEPERDNILIRLEEYVVENPLATEYVLETELEAGELLLAMAAICKEIRQSTRTLNQAEDRSIKNVARLMRRAVVQHRALEYIMELAKGEELVFRGLTLKVNITVQ